jgi:hypothetical protein
MEESRLDKEGMARYLQSRVRLVLRSRLNDAGYLMIVIYKHLPNCPGKVLQIP